jgi:hypothetical protein
MYIYINDLPVALEHKAIRVLVTDNTSVIIGNADNNCQQYLSY